MADDSADPAEEVPSTIRAVVLIAGASFFAYLFGVTVHEVGHYIANVILGVPETRIVLHPFDLSSTIEAGDLSEAFGTPARSAFAGAAGPAFNIALGTLVSLFVWTRRSPGWLPLLMWGPLALLVEGVGMVIGLVDYPNFRSDWVDVMLAGTPPTAIAILAVAAFAVGSTWMMLLLPLAGIRAEDGFWRRLLIFLCGIPLLLLGAVIYLAVVGSSADAPEGMVMQNRTIALGSSVVLVVSLTALYRPSFGVLDRIAHTPPHQPAWRQAVVAVSLGVTVFIAQLVAFN
jgi:hypothetical protein